jgi:hypothetical protein
MTTHPLPLSNGDYWSNPRSKLGDFSWKMLQENKERIVIDGPDFVPLDKCANAPIVMVGCRDEGMPHKNRFEGKCIGVCIDVETGKPAIGSLLRTPDRPGNNTPSPGTTVEDFVVDLRTALGLPWESSAYSLWVVYFDQISNRITLRLSKSESAFNSPEENDVLNKRASGTPRRPLQKNDGIIFSKSEAAGSGGFRIKNEQEKSQSKIVIEGKLPIVPNVKVATNEQQGALAGITAVLPVELLIIGTNPSSPYIVHSLGVPSYSQPKSEENQEWCGISITIDIDSIKKADLKNNDDAYLYIFSSIYSIGPVKI